MKKMMKRVMAFALAAVMMLAMTATVFAADAVPAAAEKTYTITINGAGTGHTYEAYQVFKGDLSTDGNTLSNIEWGSSVDGVGLLAALKAAGGKFAGCESAADVAEALDGVADNAEAADAFAAIVGKHLTNAAGSSSESNDSYTISGLSAGYYLVKDKDGSVSGADAYTKFMLQVVTDVTATAKTGVPSVEKKVMEESYPKDEGYGAGYNDVADWDIGDAVPFKLIGKLPANLADYDTYNYIFHDTLSAGLTYNSDATVSIDGADATGSFTILMSNGELTVSCADVTSITGVTKDSKIIVEYTATLNKNAQVGLPGNLNEVYLEFSNNPNKSGSGDSDNTGETPKDEVIVFTFELDVTKVDGASKDDLTGLYEKMLAGAEFKLYDAEGNYVQVDATGKVNGWTKTEAEASTLVSGADGLFKVIGLDDGTYYLKETKAPNGFNTLKEPVTLVIAAATANGQTWAGTPGEALTALTITVGDNTAVNGDTATGIVPAVIENNSGALLPSTGGIGTTIFYIVGILVMAGAVFFFAMSRRKKEH